MENFKQIQTYKRTLYVLITCLQQFSLMNKLTSVCSYPFSSTGLIILKQIPDIISFIFKYLIKYFLKYNDPSKSTTAIPVIPFRNAQ